MTCLEIYLENITYTCCCIYSLAQTFFKRVFFGSCVSRIINFACKFLAVSLSVVYHVKHTVHLVKCHSLLQICICASIDAKMVTQGLLFHQNVIRFFGSLQ